MAESTLSLGFVEFSSRVARQLGYDPLAANRTAAQVTQVGEIVQSGYRQFLYPPPLPSLMTPHEWSFLRASTTIATVASDYDTDLPDTFGGMEGTFTFATTASRIGPITLVDENQIRTMREGDSGTTGTPRYAAVRAKTATAGTTGQRFEVIFWPTPDAVYTLGYRYHVYVAILSTTAPYPLGGMAHCETVLASCQQRAAEESDDDPVKYKNIFAERMLASVNHDRQRFTQEYFGNGNRALGTPWGEPLPVGVSYNNVYPS